MVVTAGVGVGVTVGLGVGVTVGTGVFVAVGSGVGVLVAVGTGVFVGACVGTAVGVMVAAGSMVGAVVGAVVAELGVPQPYRQQAIQKDAIKILYFRRCIKVLLRVGLPDKEKTDEKTRLSKLLNADEGT